MAMASVALTMSGDTVQSARVVLGAVAPVPWRSPAAEAVLKGKAVTEQVAAEAAEAAVKNAKPMSQNGYKVQLARTTVMRAIMQASEGGVGPVGAVREPLHPLPCENG